MAKRKRNDDVLNQHHEDEDDDEQQLRAVFVDTNIDTNIIVLISPFSSFSLLKERIVREHANCFAELGEIKINALKVKREQKYYRLSESMLLRTAFHGVETWFVFADVDKASLGQSPKTHSDPVTELQLNLTNHEHASNLPNDPSKDSESEAMERGSDIGSPVAQNGSKRKRRKKEKHNSEDLSLALASSVPAENVHKIESIIAVDKSLLETKGLVSGFEGEPLETKQPVSKKDDLQKNDGASINFPSKVVETSTEGEVRTKEMRYNHPSIVRHVHGASSELEGSGKISGSTLNQESVVHNAEAISEPRVRKAKKNKKGGGDGADKIHSAKVGSGPDVMPYDVAAGRESDRINTTIEETPLKQTDDSKLLLSRHEEVNKEDAPLMSSELKNNTESRNASKKRRSSKAESEHQDLSSIRESADPESADTRQKGASTTSGETLKEAGCKPRAKKTKKTNTKDVDGSLQVLKSIQYDVTALDSEKAACERESNSKIIAEEKILETGNIAKKKKYKTKETDQDLDDSRQDVAEILQQADISKPEQNPESANVTEETKVDKSKPSKKTKKSKKNERASEVLPQIVNNNSVAEPAKSSKHEENSELMSVNLKKSKSRQTTPAVDVPENPVLQQVAEGKMADDDVSTNNNLSPNKHQSELNDDEHEHLNENAAQKVYSQETDMRNLVKQTTKKPKRKKLDQPSSIDTSSNLMAVEKGYESERTSLVSNQIQSDVQEAGLVKVIGVESFHPQLSAPEVNGEITGIRPKKKAQRKHSASEHSSSILHMKQQQDAETQKTVVEQADDVMPSHNVNDADHQERVSLHDKCHDGSTEVRKSDNQPLSNVKANKLDLSTSVDTPSNGENLSKVSERNAQAEIELQNNVQESELSDQIGTESSPTHQISQCKEHLNIQSVEVIKPKEVSSSLAETRIPEKPRPSKHMVKNKDLPTSALAGSKEKNLTVSTSWKEVTATQVPVTDAVKTQVAPDQNNPIRKSDVSCPNLNDGSKSSGTSSLISEKSAKMIHMGKNMKEVQKRKNQENSFETPLNKKNQEFAFKTPSNKNVGLPASSVPQKKQLPATSGGLFGGLYSDSSDGEVERNGSSCSTRTPDDLSFSDYSSDYSEGESKGDVVTSQQKSNGSRSAREKTNSNLSAIKDQDIKSILRSSRRFKNAKLAASQSQMEDGESEPPEFVPDSQPDA